jgi:hypothetical protein
MTWMAVVRMGLYPRAVVWFRGLRGRIPRDTNSGGAGIFSELCTRCGVGDQKTGTCHGKKIRKMSYTVGRFVIIARPSSYFHSHIRSAQSIQRQL